MAVNNLFDQYRLRAFNQADTIDLDTDTIKAALVTGTYTPDQNLHDYWDDASANEVSGDGYTAGGETLANAAVTIDGSGNVTFDADDVTWLQGATGVTNARRLILYKDTGTPSTSPLIAFSEDFGADKGNDAGDFTIEFSASGIITSAR